MFKAATYSLVSLISLTACVAQEDIILPTKYQRIAEANAYKQCVAQATNRKFDEITTPESIARSSLAECAFVKKTMLRAYPQRWRENYIKDIDAELYEREVNWVVETRTKKNKFFR